MAGDLPHDAGARGATAPEGGGAFAIVALCVGACVVYGVLHDQVTARIAIEHFTVLHPTIVDSTDPTVLALLWGVIATWWVGLFGGILLAVAARAGTRPKRGATTLLRPVALALVLTASCAAIGGFVGRALAGNGHLALLEPVRSRIPAERHLDVLTVIVVHNVSYVVGGIAFVTLAVLVWRSRERLHPPTAVFE
ncbi:MAG: hypothetical protein JNM10_01785 [Planctomycetia bacterium]|nr:hypothetical protein [Planctomycetia bacterium]